MAKHILLRLILTAIGCVLLTSGPDVRAANLPVVPKWERFELTLRSRHAYTNALQETELRVLFVSPLRGDESHIRFLGWRQNVARAFRAATVRAAG